MGLFGERIWVTGVLVAGMAVCIETQRLVLLKPRVCSAEQDLTDLECPCRFRGLPCRVAGSVCSPGFLQPGGARDNELRCQCGGFFQRDGDRNCIEMASVLLGMPPPQSFQELGVPMEQIEGPNDFDFAQNSRVGAKPGATMKRPTKKKPPFKTVIITSSPLTATVPSRRPQTNPFQRPSLPQGMGIGAEGPSVETILAKAKPFGWTRPTMAFGPSKGFAGKGPAFGKGPQFSKRPTFFPKRTTRAIPRADGSRVVNGWYPDIWPAVGLNYSI